MPIALVVALYVSPNQEAAFAHYESIATGWMREHGGEIVRALRCAETGQGEATPYEIHWVQFASKQALDDYLSDPRLAEQASLRASAICRTELWTGHEIAPLGGAAL